MNGVRIDYGGIAVGAKEKFIPAVNDKESFVDLHDLQQENVEYVNYVNPCEIYSVILDGSGLPLPSDTENINLGLWSKQITDNNGFFATPIVLTLSSSESFSSNGITLIFDTFNGIYANSLNIQWYRNTTLLSDKNYTPDNGSYFCPNEVQYFNKLVITFYGINMPNNRLKLRGIEYGLITYFSGDEIRNIKVIQEIDPISTQISINTCDFTLNRKGNLEYTFQDKQPVNVYFNDQLISKSFIKNVKRRSKDIWDIQSEDYIGLLDAIPFYGGMYNNKNAVELITEISEISKVPISIDSSLSAEIVKGYIPYTTCRNALMQIAFAIGAVVDTSYSDKVNVTKLKEETTQNLPLNRIMQGQNFDNETKVTSIEITVHDYKKISDSITVYDSSESGVARKLFVVFSEPLHDLNISNGSIVSSGTNYAIINTSTGILSGQRYEHTMSIKKQNMPNVQVTDIENIISISNATLVSYGNIDKILNRCYNYYKDGNRINLKIVEGKHEVKTQSNAKAVIYDETTKVGERISCDTEYLGNLSGIIEKQTYNLNGGIIIKDTIVKQEIL